MAENTGGIVLYWQRVCAGSLQVGKNLILEPDYQALNMTVKTKTVKENSWQTIE